LYFGHGKRPDLSPEYKKQGLKMENRDSAPHQAGLTNPHFHYIPVFWLSFVFIFIHLCF
jgi:hypothetical protein